MDLSFAGTESFDFDHAGRRGLWHGIVSNGDIDLAFARYSCVDLRLLPDALQWPKGDAVCRMNVFVGASM
jgi:hypothetical protein